MAMTDTPGPPEEASRVYALRIVGPARADIDEARAHLARTAGEPIADEWQDGFFAAIRQLATMPRKQAIAPENRYFPEEVRQLVYRRRPGSAAYRVLFSIAQEGDDPPFVRILHVRHGSRRPMTRAEAQERRRAINEEA